MRLPSLTPERAVEIFIVSNLAFLGVDILLAHAENAFASPWEWVPVAFSALAPLLLVPGFFGARTRERIRPVAITVGATSILVGVAGMLLHLESAFFARQTLRDLVYAAPFAAPLAYVGVGLLLLLTRMESPSSRAWGPWVVFLAFGGFAGNFALSLLDHAQNGFFSPFEWVSVLAAAFGASFLLLAALRPRDTTLLRACLGVLALEALVGTLGFGLHVSANLRHAGVTLADRFIFGAPAFAPLLFADLAVLGALGIWALLRDAAQKEPSPEKATPAEEAPAS